MGQRPASFVLRKIGGEEGIFRKILDNASDCILFLDQSGRVLDVNRKAVSVFGGPKKDLLGKHFTETGVLGLGEKARLVKAFEEGMA
ncbi:MAG: PAS domain-containing protein, partial [Candidatus Bathyarchaeota archaeon]|nr:PAS domain-containing protein [Candidatus Bathyarchaeota archaeon]